jgi:hypothetical protein
MGTELSILPVDGVYHAVCRGETVESIAADYGAALEDLYNEWNDLGKEKQPAEGQMLVVPGGRGKEPDWQPLHEYPAPGPAEWSLGACGDTLVVGPGGHGWFTYPTGRSEVSGWVFHDPAPSLAHRARL